MEVRKEMGRVDSGRLSERWLWSWRRAVEREKGEKNREKRIGRKYCNLWKGDERKKRKR